MALTLRSTTSVQRSDKIASLLDKIITPGTDAAQAQLKTAKETHRSEYEVYMEKETWTKMKTERDKDMVLMFGDDDVRVFKRNPSNQIKAAKLRSAQKLQRTLSRHDLVDVSGLIPVALDKKIISVVSSGEGYTPYSQEERARIAQRKQEIALRRQQIANQYVFVSQNANSQATAQQQQHALLVQQMAELGIQMPTDTTRGEEPCSIPLRAWQTWIPRRTEAGKDGQDAAGTHGHRQKRLRRRHHRLHCKYHPFSTNGEMRRLAIQSSFPRTALHYSTERLQHAANGAPNGQGTRFNVDECFANVEYVQPLAPSSTTAGDAHGGTVLSPSPVAFRHPVPSTSQLPGGFGAGAARALRRSTSASGSSWGPLALNESVRQGEGELPHVCELPSAVLPPAPSRSASVSTSADARGDAVGTFSLTATNFSRTSATERCHIPTLAPFERPPRPHSQQGTYIDCDCTPRDTDDELDMFGLNMLDIEESPKSPTEGGSSSSPGKKKKESSLLGSAARAEKRLELWHKDFTMTNVHSISGLQSLLEERESFRNFVTAEREHLNLVTHEAELSGADFRVSRRHRCTTPSRASMWTPVMDAIGVDMRHVARNATAFAALLDHCEEHGFPSQPWELEFLQEIRAKCVANASVRQQRSVSPISRSSSANTSPSRSRPSSQQRRDSHRNSVGSSDTKVPPERRRSMSIGGLSMQPSLAGLGSASSSSAAVAASGDRSVFLASQKKTPATVVGEAHEIAFNETFAVEMLEAYGARLFKTKGGVEVANFWRELCQVNNKNFLAFIFSKEQIWDMCPEVHQLQKRLAASNK